MRRALVLWSCVVLGTACRSNGGARGGGDRATPGADLGGWPSDVASAEVLLRSLRTAEGVATLESAGGIDVHAPERSWLLIDLYASRARAHDARVLTDALPDGPMADVLRAHARRDPVARLASIGRAFSSPAAAWAHLEAAMALAEAGQSSSAVLDHARRAAALGPAFVRREAYLVAAREALEADRGREAAELADAAASIDPADPRPPAWLSRIASRRGRRDEAVLSALSALRLQPASPRSARRVADFLREDPGPVVEARVKEVATWLSAAPTRSAEVDALLGLVAERSGDAESAKSRYRSAIARGADPVPIDRRLRTLLFRSGDVRAAVDLLRGAVPTDVIVDPENELRSAWDGLLRLAAALPRRTPASAASAVVGVAVALVRVGAVDDAAALLDGVSGADALALRASCVREIAFERAIRRAVEEGYRAPAEGRKPPTLAALLGIVRDLAREHLDEASASAFAQPALGLRRVPLLGEWLDHSVRTTSPVTAHFRRFGKYLLAGQRDGKPPELILLSLASLAPAATVRTQGLLFHHDVAIGYDREIRSFVDFQGGSLSGAALPDGVWLDADASRREDHALRSALLIDPTIGPLLDQASANPSAPDGIEGVFSMDETQGLTLRLVRRYLARADRDRWGSFHVLRAHEFGHVLDLERHLPIVAGLPSSASLLASEGFALGRVEARLEGRAQLAAMRDARDPDLALVDLVSGLPNFERTPEAHERGYRAVVEALLRRLYAAADRYPAIDATKKLLPQLDRLTPEELRALGNDVARTGFTVR